MDNVEESALFEEALQAFAALEGGQRKVILKQYHRSAELKSILLELDDIIHFFPSTTKTQRKKALKPREGDPPAVVQAQQPLKPLRSWGHKDRTFLGWIKRIGLYWLPLEYPYGVMNPKSYFRKLLATPRHGGPPPKPIITWFWSAVGCFTSIVAIGTISDYALQPIGVPIYYASLGAFAVLMFAMPTSPAIQPRSCLIGTAVAATLSVSFSKAIPDPKLTWVAGGLSLTLTLVFMEATSTAHPPGGALALLYVITPSLHPMGWLFVPAALLGMAIMTSVGFIVNNIPRDRKYPNYWL